MVDERLLRIVEILLELRFIDLAGEDVVVVHGQRNEREHLAGVNIHDDGRGLTAIRRGLHHFGRFLLQVEIDREDEVVTGLGRIFAEGSQFAPGGVFLDLFAADHTAKIALVRRFDAGLADPIARNVAAIFQRHEVFFVDAAGVTEHVAQHVACEIPSDGIDDDLHAGQRGELLAQMKRCCLVEAVLDDDGCERIL